MAICRVFERQDGSLALVHPNTASRGIVDDEPEPEDEWLARTFARAIEGDPSLRGLTYVDVDDSELPLRNATCADGCGEEHPVRNQWRLSGKGEQRSVVADHKARNPYAEHRHLEQAERAAILSGEPDGSHIALLKATRDAVAAHHAEGAPLPPQALIERLTGGVR